MSEAERKELRRVFGAIGDAALPVKTFDELRLADRQESKGPTLGGPVVHA